MTDKEIDLLFDHGIDLKNRIIILNTDIDSNSSASVIKGLYLMGKSKLPIKLIISSYGGEECDMFAIHDVMKEIMSPVYTHGIGKVMSAAVLLIAAGEVGHRTCGQNTSFMVHKSVTHLTEESEASLSSELDYMKSQTKKWLNLMNNYTSKTTDEWKRIITRSGDHNFGADKALKYGIVDKII